MRVLVCGGRDYFDRETIHTVLNEMLLRGEITFLVAGCASGADHIALDWANWKQVDHAKFFAKWTEQGKKAGPIRNLRMLTEMNPQIVVGFPGGTGTADMIRRAEAAGVPVRRVG